MIITRIAFAYFGILLIALCAAMLEAFVAYPPLVGPWETVGGKIVIFMLAATLPALGGFFIYLAVTHD